MNRGKVASALSVGIVLVVLLLIPVFVSQPYVLHVLIVMAFNVILASSLRFTATIGQFSLAHAGMVSIGAYTSALLVMKLGLSFWVALPLAGFTAMVVALLVGYPLHHGDAIPDGVYRAIGDGVEGVDRGSSRDHFHTTA